jgi:hypothetical protein
MAMDQEATKPKEKIRRDVQKALANNDMVIR